MKKEAVLACLLFLSLCTDCVAAKDPVDSGKKLFVSLGCGTCHHAPGIPEAQGNVGPPLDGIAMRSYVGGVITNTPDNLARWIKNPKAIDAQSAMPATNASDEDIADLVAYLKTLKDLP